MKQLFLVVIFFVILNGCLCGEDYYKLLGVKKNASDKEIRKAFRTLAMKYHPDKNPGEESRKKFEKIASAYDVLSDPDKRRQYDMTGSDNPQHTFDYNSFYGQAGGAAHTFKFHFDDILNNAFGDDDGPFFHPHSHFHPHNAHTFHMADYDDDDDQPFGGFGGFGGFGSEGFGDAFHFTQETTTQRGSQTCRTVTKRQGNTMTTHTVCS